MFDSVEEHSAAGHRCCELGLIGFGRVGRRMHFGILVSAAGWRIFGREVDGMVDIATAGVG